MRLLELNVHLSDICIDTGQGMAGVGHGPVLGDDRRTGSFNDRQALEIQKQPVGSSNVAGPPEGFMSASTAPSLCRWRRW